MTSYKRLARQEQVNKQAVSLFKEELMDLSERMLNDPTIDIKFKSWETPPSIETIQSMKVILEGSFLKQFQRSVYAQIAKELNIAKEHK